MDSQTIRRLMPNAEYTSLNVVFESVTFHGSQLNFCLAMHFLLIQFSLVSLQCSDYKEETDSQFCIHQMPSTTWMMSEFCWSGTSMDVAQEATRKQKCSKTACRKNKRCNYGFIYNINQACKSFSYSCRQALGINRLHTFSLRSRFQ